MNVKTLMVLLMMLHYHMHKILTKLAYTQQEESEVHSPQSAASGGGEGVREVAVCEGGRQVQTGVLETGPENGTRGM